MSAENSPSLTLNATTRCVAPSSPRGFALIITITLLAFLVLILVGLARLTRVETQVATNSQDLEKARQNAIFGLKIALGELQRFAGPDQRVTAYADITTHLTGGPTVLDDSGSDPTLVNPNFESAAQTYWAGKNRFWTAVYGNPNDPQATPTAGASPARLLTWLVSGNEATPSPTVDTSPSKFGMVTSVSATTKFTPQTGVANLTGFSNALSDNLRISDSNGTPNEARILVGRNSVGPVVAGAATATDLSRYVVAPSIPITTPARNLPGFASTDTTPIRIGGYSYAVLDEGVKASLSTSDHWADPASGERAIGFAQNQSFGGHLLSHDRDNISFNASKLVGGLHPASGNRTVFNNILTGNQMAIAYQVLGISGTDLDNIQGASKFRFHDISEGSFGVLSNTLIGGLKDDLNRVLESTIGTPTPADNQLLFGTAGTVTLSDPPSWGVLRSYYAAAVSSAPGASSAAIPVRPSTNTQMGFSPIITWIDTSVGFYNNSGVIQARARPRVVLWNPYAVPLAVTGVELGYYQDYIDRFGSYGGWEQVYNLSATAPSTSPTGNYFVNATQKFQASVPTSGTSVPITTYRPLRFKIRDMTMQPGQAVMLAVSDTTLPTYSDNTQELAPETLAEEIVVDSTPALGTGPNYVMRSRRWNGNGNVHYPVLAYLRKQGGTLSTLQSRSGNSNLRLGNGDPNLMYAVFFDVSSGTKNPADLPTGPASGVRTTNGLSYVLPTSGTVAEVLIPTDDPNVTFRTTSGAGYPRIAMLHMAASGTRLDTSHGYPLLTAHGSGNMKAFPNDHQSRIDADRWLLHSNIRSPNLWAPGFAFWTNGHIIYNQSGSGSDSTTFSILSQNDVLLTPVTGWTGPTFDENNVPIWTRSGTFTPEAPPNNIGRLILFDVPRLSSTGVPLLFSISDLRHADLGRQGTAPAYTIGNSIASLWVARDQTQRTGGNAYTAYDTSYLANQALWDQYFFSTIGRTQTVSESTKLPSITLRAIPHGESLSDPIIKGQSTAARQLMNHGAFNINSTSVEAWKAILSSRRGLPYDPATGTTSSRLVSNSFTRFIYPLPADSPYPAPSATTPAEDPWRGFRVLTDAQIEELARSVVAEIRLRGPFISLAQFVNRSLVAATATNARFGVTGPIQAAIDRIDDASSTLGINKIYPFTRSVDNIGNFPDPLGTATILDKEHLFQGKKAIVPRLSRNAFIPGMITQADVLSAIGARISARSDTFKVRVYGETRNPITGDIQARAWAEATVQRVQGYVDPADPAETKPWLTSTTNQAMGRKFIVTSLRWLSPDDI